MVLLLQILEGLFYPLRFPRICMSEKERFSLPFCLGVDFAFCFSFFIFFFSVFSFVDGGHFAGTDVESDASVTLLLVSLTRSNKN